MRTKSVAWTLSFVALVAIFLFADSAQAADAGGVLDGVAQKFVSNAASWSSKMFEYAQRLFFLLALIAFVWQFVPLAASGFKGDIGDVFGPLLRWIITTGFFYFLLVHGAEYSVQIVETFTKIGGNVSGGSSAWKPSKIIDIGFGMVEHVLKAEAKMGFWDKLAIGGPLNVLVMFIMVVITLIAAQVLITYAGAYVMAYAGIIVLGFGGSSFTRDMAIAYFKQMIGIGLHLMTMLLILGIGIKEIEEMANAVTTQSMATNLADLLAVGIVSLMLYLLISRVPPMVAGLAGGGNAGAGMSGAIALGAAMGMVKGAAGVAVTAATGGANQAISTGSFLSQLTQAVGAGGESGNAPSAEERPGDTGSGATGSEQASSVLPMPSRSEGGGATGGSSTPSSSGVVFKVWAGAKAVASATGKQIVANANKKTLIGQASNALRASTAALSTSAMAAEIKKQLGSLVSEAPQNSGGGAEASGGGDISGE